MGGFAGVDIDGHQRFGLLDDNGAARFELDPVFEDGGDLFFQLIFREDRLVAV